MQARVADDGRRPRAVPGARVFDFATATSAANSAPADSPPIEAAAEATREDMQAQVADDV